MKELEDWIQEMPITVQPECVTRPSTFERTKNHYLYTITFTISLYCEIRLISWGTKTDQKWSVVDVTVGYFQVLKLCVPYIFIDSSLLTNKCRIYDV